MVHMKNVVYQFLKKEVTTEKKVITVTTVTKVTTVKTWTTVTKVTH